MGTTIEDLVEKTRSMVWGSQMDTLSLLGEPYVPGSGTVVLQENILAPGSAVQGGLLCVGLNTFYILRQSTDGKTLTVIPKADGGPEVAVPSGALVRAKPKATTWSIFREIHDAIADMASPRTGLYRALHYELPRAGFTGMYSFPQGWFDAAVQPQKLVGVHYQALANGEWLPIHTAEWNVQQYAVRILSEPEDARTYRFTFAFPYYTPENLTDELFDLGLTEKSTQDIPPLRAAARLALSLEGQRVQPKAQGDSRRPGEVPPRSNAAMSDDWMRAYEEAVRAEASRLRALFPYRFAIGDDH